MEIIKKSHLEEWGIAIDEGLSKILTARLNLEGIAGAVGNMGIQSSIQDAFKNIQVEVQNLEGQLSLLEDLLAEDGTEISRLDTGEFIIVSADIPDD
jgi:hypothetical protein